MSKEISRRHFLQLMAEGMGLLALCQLFPGSQNLLNPILKIELDKHQETLSFAEATALAKRFRNLYLQLKTAGFEQSSLDQATINNWIDELAPQFAHEGAVNQAVIPKKISFEKFSDGEEHNHLAGYESSTSQSIYLNYRMINPQSTWYKKNSNLRTLIHELTHLILFQDSIYSGADNPKLEQTAVIVTWEIMASMINNQAMIGPLVEHLFWTSFDTALSIALKEDRMPEFDQFRQTLHEDAFEKAAHEKCMRDWANKKYKLMGILRDYSEKPLTIVIKAMTSQNSQIYGLALQAEDPSLSDFRQKPFQIDDLAYFFAHAEELVAAVIADKKTG